MGKAMRNYAEYRLQENLREYNFYFKNYKRLLTSMFKWEGLPDNISQRFIENKLFYNGIVIMFKSKSLGFYVVSQATPIGINEYEEPSGFRAYSTGRINEQVKISECVQIWNNMEHENSFTEVNFFAKRLSNIQKTFDVNLEQLKNPYIISCPEGQRETVKQMIAKKTNGEPYIYMSDEWQGNGIDINVMNLNIQNHTEDLQNILSKIENQGLTHFGIDNVNVSKNERLTLAEGVQNNQQISINKNSRLVARQNACKEIKEKFGFDVSVSLNDFRQEDFDYGNV